MKRCNYVIRLFMLLIVVLLSACSVSKKGKATNKDVPITILSSGYFLRNDIILNDRIHCMVATSQAALSDYFGYGAVMGDNHVKPDFGKHYVLAMVIAATEDEVALSFDKATLTNGNLKVMCSIKRTVGKRSYTATPVLLATIKRNSKIKSVSFYDGTRLIRRVVM